MTCHPVGCNLDAPTWRFQLAHGEVTRTGYSPNRGLLCYLVEAACASDLEIDSSAVARAIRSLIEEGRLMGETMIWGWERTPSIAGVIFPADWDDTMKAVDLVKSAASFRNLPEAVATLKLLPVGEFVHDELRESCFIRNEVGVDVVFPCRFTRALAVFFGPGSDKISRREDPMVTVAVIRTVLRWYPDTATELQDLLADLYQRCMSVLRLCLHRAVDFEKMSRYYFSLGHFCYRMLEVADLLRRTSPGRALGEESFVLLQELIATAVKEDLPSVTREQAREGAGWWQLCLEDYCSGGSRVLQAPEREEQNRAVDIVFRHRRLNHYYGTEKWHSRVISFERCRAAGKLRAPHEESALSGGRG